MLNYIRRRFYYYEYYMFRMSFDTVSAGILSPIPKDMTMHVVGDVSAIHTLASSGYDLAPCPFYNKLVERVAGGAVVFFVFSGKEFVHASWAFMDHNIPPFDGIFKKINYGGSVYIGPCITAQKYRGKGIYPYILRSICEFAKRRGSTQALINVKTTNLPSIRSIEKAGFTRLMKFSCRRLLLWDFYKVNLGN